MLGMTHDNTAWRETKDILEKAPHLSNDHFCDPNNIHLK